MEHDWSIVRGMVEILETFYRVTLVVSGTQSTTSNVYLHDISHIACLLNDWVNDEDLFRIFETWL